MNFPQSLLTFVFAVVFSLGSSPASAKLTPKEIDEKVADFNKRAPERYYDQRILMTKEVTPFLNSLNASQLRGLCKRMDASIKMRDRMARYAAWRIGKLQGGPGLTFFNEQHIPRLRQLVMPALSGWTEVDPEAAVEWALKHRGEGRVLINLVDNLHSNREALVKMMALPGLNHTKARTRGMTSLGRDVIREDSRKGYQWFVDLPKDDQALLANELLPNLSPALPEETARLLPTLPTIGKRWIIIGNWAVTQPEAVLEWAAELSDENLKQDARWMAVVIWADIDPLAAWTALLRLPADDVKALLKAKSDFHRTFLETGGTGGAHSRNGFHLHHSAFAVYNPNHEDGPQIASQIGNQYRGMARMIGGEALEGIIMGRLPSELMPKVIARSEASPHHELTQTLKHVLKIRNARQDPTTVEDLVALFGGEEKASTVIDVFGRREPKKALPLALKLEKRRKSTVGHIVYDWVRHEPEEARKHIESLPEGELRTIALEAYHQSEKSFRIRNNLAETKAAFEELPLGSKERNSAFNRYLSMLLERGKMPVDEIYQKIDAHFKTQKFDPRRNPLTHDIVPTLAKRDPGALARWAKTLPESNLRHTAISEFWDRWETYGAGEGTRRLEKLGINPKEAWSSRY